jgi:hypothetical protein
VVEIEVGRVNDANNVTQPRALPKLPLPKESSSYTDQAVTGSTGIRKATATSIAPPPVSRSRVGLILGIAGALLAVATIATLGTLLVVRSGSSAGPNGSAATTTVAPSAPQPSETTQTAASLSAKTPEPKTSASKVTHGKPTTTTTVAPKSSTTPIDVGF